MGIFESSVLEFADYREIMQALKAGENVTVSGCIDACKEHLLSQFTSGKRLIVTYDEAKGRQMCVSLKMFGVKAHFYPAKDIIFYNADVHGNAIVKERIAVLKALIEDEDAVVVTTIDGLMDRLTPLYRLRNACVHIDMESKVDVEKLTEKLIYMGYVRTPQVEISGEFSVRGSIVDIYPLTSEVPVRIDLWDEEIDSIKSFDAESQRSIEMLDEITIYPAKEILIEDVYEGIETIKAEAKKQAKLHRDKSNIEAAGRIEKVSRELVERIENEDSTLAYESLIGYFVKNTVSFAEYFDKCDEVIIDEPSRIREKLEVSEKEFSESMSHRLEHGYVLPTQSNSFFSKSEILALLENHPCISFQILDNANNLLGESRTFSIVSKNINSYNNSFELLLTDMKSYKKNGYRVVLVSNSSTRAKRLSEDLVDNGVVAFYSDDREKDIVSGSVMVTYGNLARGFEYPLSKLVVIAESDIFGREHKKKITKKQYSGKAIADFNELSIGDYVVHENHGIGIYRGIEKVTVEKVTKDYMKIEYGGKSNLYVLATGLDMIQKYASQDAKPPKLNKLGDTSWEKVKTRVKSAVSEVAAELVKLYATRQSIAGYQFSPDGPWQKEFEELFPFDETNDQLEAIRATKEDMESKRVMDRLICGDVGFGKTEIAIRAAFKAVTDGKQVAYLVPTTILAQQHYNTFVQRMKDFAVRIDLLSRFVTPKQATTTIDGLKRGTVDIVVGTHKLLSKNVSFNNLGLLIVDEEQRFGVSHKEKIKQIKNDVDVLTLSATPIPRTLHMSLAGIRDMSVLEEPPVDRMPIQTFVTEHDDEMIREAINRELQRGGQVYYVYNRVNTIPEIAARIAELVPEANVVYAHGQMEERRLEKIMMDFIEGEIDVLVSTTIIETGLDIPNVNTIIIDDAENFGLSQLYQLRGRVGRSNRTAYAFLMYRRDKLLRETAEKRLHAIREFTELGSGFKIAMKDLEIRGAGSILGEKQSGHMEAVGYDLYCKLLNEAVEKLKGVKSVGGFETSVDIEVDAFVPSTYIKSEAQKLDVYKRIATIETEEEKEDMIDELSDRFGEIPKSARLLLDVSLIKAMAHKAYIVEISGKKDEIRFKMFDSAPVDVAKLPEFIAGFRRSMRMVQGVNPTFIYTVDKKEIKSNIDYLECIKNIVNGISEILEKEEEDGKR